MQFGIENLSRKHWWAVGLFEMWNSPRPKKRTVLNILVVAIIAFLASGVKAATFVVSNTASTGPGSLHEALVSSQQNLEADTIRFSVGGTILLPNQPPFMFDGGLTIDGIGHDVIISGGGVRRHFYFLSGDSAVRNLTLENGNNTGGDGQGGAIRSVVNLTIRNVLFRNNIAGPGIFGTSSGGAISHTALQLSVLNCRFINNRTVSNGGAIAANLLGSTSESVISDSHFEGNRTDFFGGGAVSILGSMRIVESVFSDNFSPEGGGAVDWGSAGPDSLIVGSTFFQNSSAGDGGGLRIAFSNLPLEIVNSTFSDNTAGGHGGAVFSHSSVLFLTNTTLAYNQASVSGGGVGNDAGMITIRNTIAGINTGGDCSTVNSGITSADIHNFDTDGSCDGASQTTATGLDLGALADNGGPTPTHALLPGSVAINSGDNFQAVFMNADPLLFDQRGPGFIRISNTTVDVGAFERGHH